VDLRSRVLPLPFGQLTLEADEEDLAWGSHRMARFVPVAELEVRGLRNRYRRFGLGAPLAAALAPSGGEESSADGGHLSRDVRVAATALVFFHGGRQRLEGEGVRGTLRLFTLDDAVNTTVGDRKVPLEYEPTAALAFGLAEARLWDFELAAFLSGDFGESQEPSLQMLNPYDPDRIPVVFVHGTASSPARWAEMLNHLRSDPVLHARYQFWIFRYNTGNPIPFSAGRLRQSLQDLVNRLDPEGDDPNLQRMVVIGHSQGGLLTKLCVVESDDAFWRLVSTAPIEALDLQPETRQTLSRSLFFSPLPFVQRVVFIATPHRGSFLAERRFARLASRFVAMSREIADVAGDMFVDDDDRILLRSLDDMPSSIDNMSPDNGFGRILVELEIPPGVESHSIIAVLEDQEDIDSGHDGVVSVESARLPGVTSELVVRSGHSAQQHPLTISEVRRILLSGVH
jgi:pimeloyl-ACP methyl ester carboxylesterase